MPKKFNPRESVSIHNPWPRHRYPIKHGSRVWALSRGEIYAGRVTWYHPSRDLDRSCVISPGNPFYRVEGREISCTSIFSAEEVRPRTAKGRRELEAMVVRGALSDVGRARAELQNRNSRATTLRRSWEKRWNQQWRG